MNGGVTVHVPLGAQHAPVGQSVGVHTVPTPWNWLNPKQLMNVPMMHGPALVQQAPGHWNAAPAHVEPLPK